MKFLMPLLVVGALAAGGLFATTAVQAQQTTMTNEHVQRIVTNCPEANRALTQLRTSDKLLRVNRGQLYDLISTRLMARLNSRLSLNRLDGSKLVSVAAAYDRALSDFRNYYDEYEDKLSATIAIDCEKRPVAFYDSVAQTRELRAKVHAAATDLNTYTREYSKEFDAFRSSFLSNTTKGERT